MYTNADSRRQQPMMTTNGFRATGRAHWLTAVAALAAIAIAGCGGSSNSNSTSNASGGTPSSQTANSNKLAQFSQCMRAHGVPDFPDPVNGQLSLKVTKGSGLDPSSPAYQSALQSCKSLEPASMQSGSPQSNQNQSKLLKFAQCMRKNGVSNFPDPSGNGTMQITGVNPSSPQFQSALQTCRSLLPPGAVGG
jgi:hypothetical protein